jgi:predicted N-formylglutamate amidohydrolase
MVKIWGITMKKTCLFLTCEHASDFVPAELGSCFLDNHPDSLGFEKFDPFSAQLTKTIANTLKCDYLLGQISREVLDLNKNHQQEHCFSDFVRNHCGQQVKQRLLENYYFKYRQSCQQSISDLIAQDFQVLHLSIHTFNPQENGFNHEAAVGLLYDSSRHGEKEVVRIWNELLIKRTPYIVRLNYPRTGARDNLTSYLRKQYPESDYIGIELECNALLLEYPAVYSEFSETMIHSIYSLIELL